MFENFYCLLEVHYCVNICTHLILPFISSFLPLYSFLPSPFHLLHGRALPLAGKGHQLAGSVWSKIKLHFYFLFYFVHIFWDLDILPSPSYPLLPCHPFRLFPFQLFSLAWTGNCLPLDGKGIRLAGLVCSKRILYLFFLKLSSACIYSCNKLDFVPTRGGGRPNPKFL